MISPAGRGHAPHTQTTQPLMAPPCCGTTAGTGTVRSVTHTEERSETFSDTYGAILKLRL